MKLLHPTALPLAAVVFCSLLTAHAAYAKVDDTYGVCSYFQTSGSLQNLTLVSESACIKKERSGTGFWIHFYEWENGNTFTYVMNAEKPEGEEETINGFLVLERGSTNGRNTCWITKQDRGFDVSCFEAIGLPMPPQE